MTTEEKKFQAKLKMIKYNVSYIQDDGKIFEANVKGKYMAAKSKMSIEDLANIIIPRLDKIENTLEEHSIMLKEHSGILQEHSTILQKHSEKFILIENKLQEHSEKFILIESRLDKIENTLEEHSIILQEHSEKFILIENKLQEHSDIFQRNNLK